MIANERTEQIRQLNLEIIRLGDLRDGLEREMRKKYHEVCLLERESEPNFIIVSGIRRCRRCEAQEYGLSFPHKTPAGTKCDGYGFEMEIITKSSGAY